MLEHFPGRGTAQRLFFEAGEGVSKLFLLFAKGGEEPRTLDGRSTYQHSIKYLKLSLHLIPLSGSSFNLGMG